MIPGHHYSLWMFLRLEDSEMEWRLESKARMSSKREESCPGPAALLLA